MQTVIVATDFSEAALRAAKFAAWLTGQLPFSRLLLYHSYDIPVATEVPVADLEMERQLYERSRHDLNTLKETLAPLAASQVTIDCRADGWPLAAGLKDLTLEEHADLLVMGIAGKSKIKERLLGSHAVAMAKGTGVPLLLVPFDADFKKIDKVVFAWDMKDTRETFPEVTFKNFIRGLHAELLVLNVDHNEKHFSSATMEEQKRLYGLLEAEHPQYFYNDHPDAAGGILQFAEKREARLIILLRKEHPFPENLFRTDVTKKMAFHTHVPLLILPQKGISS